MFPTFQEAESYNADKKIYEEYTYLFSVDDRRFYLGDGISYEGLKDYDWAEVRSLRYIGPKHLSFAAVTGWQLHNWYNAHRFCGHCAAPMVKDEKERMLRCPECGIMEFPKICPAVIVGVTHGSKILMSKYAGREYKKYALLAGFAEIGETIEDTVRREVMEEVGLKVRNISYYKSQPWSFSDSLLFGFFCELDGDETIILDQEELAMAEWFERADMPVNEGEEDISLTNEMILAFKSGEFPKVSRNP